MQIALSSGLRVSISGRNQVVHDIYVITSIEASVARCNCNRSEGTKERTKNKFRRSSMFPSVVAPFGVGGRSSRARRRERKANQRTRWLVVSEAEKMTRNKSAPRQPDCEEVEGRKERRKEGRSTDFPPSARDTRRPRPQ